MTLPPSSPVLEGRESSLRESSGMIWLLRATISSALAHVFHGRYGDAILANRKATTFEKNDVIFGQDT